MYGARCISSVARGETSDGLIYGHGSITLMLVFTIFEVLCLIACFLLR